MQNRLLVIWSALLYFQLMLLGIIAFLASRTPEGMSLNFDPTKFLGHPNMTLTLVGMAAFVAAFAWPVLKPHRAATTEDVKPAPSLNMAQFILPLIALEIVNLMGFLLAFLNHYDLAMMAPFTVLTVIGFAANFPKNAA